MQDLAQELWWSPRILKVHCQDICVVWPPSQKWQKFAFYQKNSSPSSPHFNFTFTFKNSALSLLQIWRELTFGFIKECFAPQYYWWQHRWNKADWARHSLVKLSHRPPLTITLVSRFSFLFSFLHCTTVQYAFLHCVLSQIALPSPYSRIVRTEDSETCPLTLTPPTTDHYSCLKHSPLAPLCTKHARYTW